MWDPGTYQRFAAERARPFADLVARVGAGASSPAPQTVVDLGCGPGDRTATLLERWPGAVVTGVDSSPQMLADAAQHAVPLRLAFEQGDLRTWRPPAPVDVVVSNAALQWVPGHLDLLPDLVGALAPGGWLAFQVPGDFDAPSHRLLADLRRSPRWRDRVGEGADRALAVHDPLTYATALLHLHADGGPVLEVDAWETTYLHVLPGRDPVLRWLEGTALRPVLAALDADERGRFLAELAPLLREAHPAQPWGTALPFRRVFVVAHRTDGA